MDTFSSYLDLCKTAVGVKTDKKMAEIIGTQRQYLGRCRKGEQQPSNEIIIELAQAAGFPPDHALILRGLWAAQNETKPYYASILAKLAGCFLACVVLLGASLAPDVNALKYNDNFAQNSVENGEVINIMRSLRKLLERFLSACAEFAGIWPYGLFRLWGVGRTHKFKGRLRLSRTAS